MIVLDLLACGISWLADKYAPEPESRSWPDGEHPLVDMVSGVGEMFGLDGTVFKDPRPTLSKVRPVESLPSWYGGDNGLIEVSVGSAASEAGVVPAERPAGPELQAPGPAGHLTSAASSFAEAHTPATLSAQKQNTAAESPAGAELRAHTPAGRPNPTAGLCIAAAIGLRDYADSDDCEAPVFYRSIADQLDPK